MDIDKVRGQGSLRNNERGGLKCLMTTSRQGGIRGDGVAGRGGMGLKCVSGKG